MSKISISPLLNITGAPLRHALWGTTIVLHIALIPIILGIWSTMPSYVQTFSNWIHLVVGLYLIIRFRPYQEQVMFHTYDRAFVFSAGLFMLEALLASMLLNSPWGKYITIYLKSWGDWLKSFPFIASFLSQTEKSSSSSDSSFKVSPNSSTSSLGGSVYELV